MRLVNPATTKRGNLFDPTIFVNAPTSDSAKVGLAIETTMVLRLIVNADRFDPRWHHDRSHLSHFRWLVHHRPILSPVVLETKVFVHA